MNIPQTSFTRWFVRRSSLLAAVAIAFLLVGCDPRTVVEWSPDGEHALVFGATGAVLIDADGKILGPAQGARAWMPDSRHLLAIRETPAKSWEEIAKLLPPQRTETIIHASEELAALMRDFHGEWKDFVDLESVKHWGEGYQLAEGIYQINDAMARLSVTNEEMMPLFYLNQKYPELTAPLVKQIREMESLNEQRPDLPKSQKDEFLKSPLGGLTPAIEELVLRNALPGEPAEEKLLWRCANEFIEALPSPDGKNIAVITREPQRPAMYVISVEDGSQISIDFGMTQAVWSPDSQWLIYAKTGHSQVSFEDNVVLGSITRARPHHAPEDLAGVLCSKGNDTVACLPDGRILFSGVSAAFPMPASSQSQKLKFFLLNLDNQKIEEVPGQESAAYLPASIDFFTPETAEDGRVSSRARNAIGIPKRKWSLSPDGKRVAVLGREGNVAILTLATGALEEVQPAIEGTGDKGALLNKTEISNVVPSWRKSSELTFVSFDSRYGPGSKRAEVALHDVDAGTTRFISAGWSNDVTDSFLPLPKSK